MDMRTGIQDFWWFPYSLVPPWLVARKEHHFRCVGPGDLTEGSKQLFLFRGVVVFKFFLFYILILVNYI